MSSECVQIPVVLKVFCSADVDMRHVSHVCQQQQQQSNQDQKPISSSSSSNISNCNSKISSRAKASATAVKALVVKPFSLTEVTGQTVPLQAQELSQLERELAELR